MTENKALGAGVSARTITTIAEAVSELTRLYHLFDRKAVEMTPTYWKERLLGEEGKTWFTPDRGFMRSPIPIFDPVLRRDGLVLFGAGCNRSRELLFRYSMKNDARVLPGGSQMEPVVSFRRMPVGFDPGVEYSVSGDRLFEAGYDHHGSAPTTGYDGKLAWSSPRSFVNDELRPVDEVEPALLELIEALRSFEQHLQQG